MSDVALGIGRRVLVTGVAGSGKSTFSRTPLDASNIRRHFHKACEQATLRPRRIHDWLVTAASWLADLNVHPDTAKQVTRHSQSSTLMEYYTSSSSESRRAALEALDDLFNG